jgi:hypothetical protein
MPRIDDTPNTPGCIGYDNTKPATYSGSNPGIPIDADKRPDWASGRHEYDIMSDRSTFRLTVQAAGQSHSCLSDPTMRHGLDRETAVAVLRRLADQIERAG